jgi:hypothetical protein
MVLDAKNTKKALTLPKTMVCKNGDCEPTSFNDTVWGSVTRIRMEFVDNTLRLTSLEGVIDTAKNMTVAGSSKETSNSTFDDGLQMVDNSDGESDCK